jgi:dienelactone hydrolase
MSNTQPDGYLAIPPGGEGSPVLVLHAWWGLNDTTRRFCARLAESGFVAFAPGGHWFFEPDRTEAFNQAAASLAWDRTLAFLGRSSPSLAAPTRQQAR